MSIASKQPRIKAKIYPQPIYMDMTRCEALGAIEYYRSCGWDVQLSNRQWHIDFIWKGQFQGWIDLEAPSSVIPCRDAVYRFHFYARQK